MHAARKMNRPLALTSSYIAVAESQAMVRVELPLVNAAGRIVGYGDRWQSHRVRDGPDGPVPGLKHIGITIACLDDRMRILTAHRRHRIFDKVWTLSGDTHPYRVHGMPKTETLIQASRRCAIDDLGIKTKGWRRTLTVSYSARDPRDPRYCENELLHLMVAKPKGPFQMNQKHVYELRWRSAAEISRDSVTDQKKDPIDRKYAPWVHALFSIPSDKVEEALLIR